MFIFRELDLKRRYFLILTVCLLFVSKTYSQSALWVGETYRCDATSAVMGLTSDISWTNNGGYVNLTGSGFYRDVKVTQYFSGSATIIVCFPPIDGEPSQRPGLLNVKRTLCPYLLQS